MKVEEIDVNMLNINVKKKTAEVDIHLNGTILADELHMVADLANHPSKEVNIRALLNKKQFTPLYGGAFHNNEGQCVYIKKVMYNKPVVIVFWSDNTKTTAKCDAADPFSREAGLVIAVLKKLQNSDFVAALLKDWIPDDEDVRQVTLSDVRKYYRA